MCELTQHRGIVVLLLGEAKVKCDIEFFCTSLNVVCEKLCRTLSRTSRPIYLSFVSQDISPFHPDDPIALSWESVSTEDECRSHLYEKLNRSDEEKYKDIDSLDLSRITSIMHGLLDSGVNKLGPSMLLDVIIPLSESGVSQLCEGEGALELYGALRRVRWQNGHVTVMHYLSVTKDLVISSTINNSVVMAEGEKLDCIDENLWWRGAFHPTYDPFDTGNKEKQISELSLSINFGLQKEKDKKNLPKKRHRLEDKDLKAETHLMLLVVKEIVKADFPLFWLDSKYLNLYSSDVSGERALLNLRGCLTSGGGRESAAILTLLPCTVEQTLNTDTWYEYVIGKQSHWVNSIKLQILQTPNYCIPHQPSMNGVWRVWRFREILDIPDQIIEDHLQAQRDKDETEMEKETRVPLSDISLPEFGLEHIRILHSTWSKMLELNPQAESGEMSEEFQRKVDEIFALLDSLPPAPLVSMSKFCRDTTRRRQTQPQDRTETLEYRALCGIDRYFKLSEQQKQQQQTSNLRSLGGFSPPPMTHSKGKIGVDSLLKCFDQEGNPIGDLEPMSLPSSPKRKDIRTRLFGNAAEAGEDPNPFDFSWANFQKHRIKDETKGLMNYESPPKSKLQSMSSLSQEPSSSLPVPDPVSFLKNKISKSGVSNYKSCSKKLTAKTHLQTKGRSKGTKPSKETKPRPKSVSESAGDKELRTLLERAVVKALKGEQLTRDHPQFKSAYAQLFNVCKCFLAGLDVETAKEKVEQIATTNAKQVIELQVKK